MVMLKTYAKKKLSPECMYFMQYNIYYDNLLIRVFIYFKFLLLFSSVFYLEAFLREWPIWREHCYMHVYATV